MQALKARKSSREFSPEKLSPQVLSDLLWAAWGVNRPDGHRTAPSAHNRREIELYVALPEGAFRYDADAHRLDPVAPKDLRAVTGTQDFVGSAPVNLVYVADLSLTAAGSPEEKLVFSSITAGAIAQNVHLFCASEGLATVVRGSIDHAALAKALQLSGERRILLAQTVGRPR